MRGDGDIRKGELCEKGEEEEEDRKNTESEDQRTDDMGSGGGVGTLLHLLRTRESSLGVGKGIERGLKS